MSTSEFIKKRPRVILFGDSLTEKSFDTGGWGASLANYYCRRADVINRGFGGYNTVLAQYLLDEVFGDCSAKNTLLVTVFLGANDAARPLSEGTAHSSRQHVPTPDYKENLRKIIAAIRAKGITNILLIGPPPVYEPGRKQHQQLIMGAEAETLSLDRTNDFTKQYSVACQELAQELGLPLVELWSSMQAVEGWGTKLFNDGLHFTPEGNQHVWRAVDAAINASYPDVRPEALPLHFPPWDAFDGGPRSAAFMKSPKA